MFLKNFRDQNKYNNLYIKISIKTYLSWLLWIFVISSDEAK